MGFSACIALFGLNEWLNPRSPQITGRLAWLYKYAEAHWGPTGPGISILDIAFLFFVLGLMLWCRAARQSTLDLHPGEHHDLYKADFGRIMKNLQFLWRSPLRESAMRSEELELQLSKLNGADQPDEKARLTALLEGENELRQYLQGRMNERATQERRKNWSASPRGVLRLLGLAVVVLFFLVVKKQVFG